MEGDLPRVTHEDMRREVMRKVKFGQTICIRDNLQEPDPPRVRVTAFYPNFVLCQGAGFTICYRYYELWARLRTRHTTASIPEYIRGVVN